MVHGGWPFTREITALLTKPNAYLDYSVQALVFPPATIAPTLHEWLVWVPEKVLFGTRIRIAVETRGRKRKDDIEWIDSLVGKYLDLNVQKIIAISYSGFSASAVAKARAKNIDALTAFDVK